jgi:hypothetical protein
MLEVAHHLQRDRRASGELVPGGDGQHARLGEEHRTDGEVGLFDGQPGDQDVDLTAAQAAEQVGERGWLKRSFQVGWRARKVSQ